MSTGCTAFTLETNEHDAAMDGLVLDDPLALEAALTLVDDWHDDAEKGGMADVATSSRIGHGLRNRGCDELMRLRFTVQEIQQHQQKTTLRRPVSSEVMVSDRHNGDPEATQAQARRLLQAVHAYNRLCDASRPSVAARSMTLAVDDEQILATLGHQLETLTNIARGNRASVAPRVWLTRKPALAEGSFRAFIQVGYYLPFKLSHAAEVLWGLMQISLFGGRQLGELSIQKPDEVFGMVASSFPTQLGLFAYSGPTALRRVYEPDGSVLLLYASVGSATSSVSGDPPSILAGCTVKQAGWARLRRVQQKDAGRLDRPLILLEMSQSMAVGALPGLVVSNEKLLRIWDAAVELFEQEPRSREALENRLMDMSLASQKTIPSNTEPHVV